MKNGTPRFLKLYLYSWYWENGCDRCVCVTKMGRTSMPLRLIITTHVRETEKITSICESKHNSGNMEGTWS